MYYYIFEQTQINSTFKDFGETDQHISWAQTYAYFTYHNTL